MSETGKPQSDTHSILPWQPELWEQRWRNALAAYHRRAHHPVGRSHPPVIQEQTAWGWLTWSDSYAPQTGEAGKTGAVAAAITVLHPARKRPHPWLLRLFGPTPNTGRVRTCVLSDRTDMCLLQTIRTADAVAHIASTIDPQPEAIADAIRLAHRVLWHAVDHNNPDGPAFRLVPMVTGLGMIAQALNRLIRTGAVTTRPTPLVRDHVRSTGHIGRSAFQTAVDNLEKLGSTTHMI